MKPIAIIPARIGSRRIPAKNIKPFNGIPVIIRTIKKAIESNLFDAVYVSSDSLDILEIAKSAGATGILRDSSLSDDYTSTVAVMKNTIQNFENNEIDLTTQICCLYPVTPLLDYKRVFQASEILESQEFDYVFPVLPYPSPISRAIYLNKLPHIEKINQESVWARTQDSENAYYDAGQFYLGFAETWIDEKPILSRTSGVVVLDKFEVIDVDYPEDWIFAEELSKVRWYTRV